MKLTPADLVNGVSDLLPHDPFVRRAMLAEMRDYLGDVLSVFDRSEHEDARADYQATYDACERAHAVLGAVAWLDQHRAVGVA